MNARVVFCLVALSSFLLPSAAHAQKALSAQLTGYQEVPAISTRATGTFEGTLAADENSITFTVGWNQKLAGVVTQSHLHFAQEGVNGGIMVFLCTNLGNGPVGTPACPTGEGEVSGTIDASDVGTGAAGQGITTEQFGKLVRALNARAVYVNVHTDTFASGELRGQIDIAQ